MTEKKRQSEQRVVALGDAEPEDVFRKMFREADKKIRPELRRQRKGKKGAKGKRR